MITNSIRTHWHLHLLFKQHNCTHCANRKYFKMDNYLPFGWLIELEGALREGGCDWCAVECRCSSFSSVFSYQLKDLLRCLSKRLASRDTVECVRFWLLYRFIPCYWKIHSTNILNEMLRLDNSLLHFSKN